MNDINNLVTWLTTFVSVAIALATFAWNFSNKLSIMQSKIVTHDERLEKIEKINIEVKFAEIVAENKFISATLNEIKNILNKWQ